MIQNLLWVALGSAVGGVLRYLVTLLASHVSLLGHFPFGTWAVNVIGCALIGFLSEICFRGLHLGPDAKLILITGFCGGFTTFSTFMNDNFKLLSEGRYWMVALYLLLSIVLGMSALVGGHRLAKLF